MLGRAALLLAGAATLAVLMNARTPAGRSLRDFDVHYAPEENLETIDAGLIGHARRSIDVMAYVLTDRTVFFALDAASRRGVRVRVWRDARMKAEIGASDLDATTTPAFEIRTSRGRELMHLKGYCIDAATLRTGSANFSHSGERYQDNDLVILRGPGACAGFEAKFERAWRSAPGG